MSIAYLYSKYDEIAELIKSRLVLNFDDIVYCPPTIKFSEEIVLKKLEKIKYAIFLISRFNVSIDTKTLRRLKFLKENARKIFVIIPHNKKIEMLEDSKNVEFIRYKKLDDLIDYFLALLKKKNFNFLHNLVLSYALLMFYYEKFLRKKHSGG
jgi:hypothetical protein